MPLRLGNTLLSALCGRTRAASSLRYILASVVRTVVQPQVLFPATIAARLRASRPSVPMALGVPR
jgi:hypothetical protein